MRATTETMIGTMLTLAIQGYATDAYMLSHKIANMAYVRSAIESDTGVPQSQPQDKPAGSEPRAVVSNPEDFGGAFG